MVEHPNNRELPIRWRTIEFAIVLVSMSVVIYSGTGVLNVFVDFQESLQDRDRNDLSQRVDELSERIYWMQRNQLSESLRSADEEFSARPTVDQLEPSLIRALANDIVRGQVSTTTLLSYLRAPNQQKPSVYRESKARDRGTRKWIRRLDSEHSSPSLQMLVAVFLKEVEEGHLNPAHPVFEDEARFPIDLYRYIIRTSKECSLQQWAEFGTHGVQDAQ